MSSRRAHAARLGVVARHREPDSHRSAHGRPERACVPLACARTRCRRHRQPPTTQPLMRVQPDRDRAAAESHMICNKSISQQGGVMCQKLETTRFVPLPKVDRLDLAQRGRPAPSASPPSRCARPPPVARGGGMSGGAAPRLPGPPGAPVATEVTGDSLTLAWASPASSGGLALKGYQVLVQAGGTAGYVEVVASTGSSEPAAYVKGLAPSTWYEFKVAARNDIGAGPQSAASRPVRTVAAAAAAPPPARRESSHHGSRSSAGSRIPREERRALQPGESAALCLLARGPWGARPPRAPRAATRASAMLRRGAARPKVSTTAV